MMRGTWLALVLAACGGDGGPTAPRGSVPAPLPLELRTAHFTLHYGNESAALMAGYAEVLEASWPRITNDLAQPGLGRIEGFFHPDAAAFTAATGYQARGSVDGPNRFHVVALPQDPSVPVHEFAHNVTLHLAPGVANNPLWLWESVAVFAAEQFVAPASVAGIASGSFPRLADIDRGASGVSIYEVGYTIAEYTVEEWGWAGLRRLLVAHGDTASALGVPLETYERGWHDFVAERYL